MVLGLLHNFVGNMSKSARLRQLVMEETGGTVDGLKQLKRKTAAIVSQGRGTPEDRRKLTAIVNLHKKALRAQEEQDPASVVGQENIASNSQATHYYQCVTNTGKLSICAIITSDLTRTCQCLRLLAFF